MTWEPQNRDIIYATNRDRYFGPVESIRWRGRIACASARGRCCLCCSFDPQSSLGIHSRSSINTNIWRIRFNGPKDHAIRTRLIASSRQEVQPAFSPDGTRIAFTSNRSGPQEIWICRSDGSDVVQLTHLGHGRTGTPRWSPDGRQIVFDSRRGGRSNIYAIYVDGALHSRSPITD